MTVEVILPLPLDEAFTYAVPEALAAEARPGARVLVPFGRRRLTGVVVGEGQPPEALDFELKHVLDVLDDEPALTPELLRLTRWMADYYVCCWGEALKAALPAGTGVRSERRLTRTDVPRERWTENGAAGDGVAAAALHYLDAHGTTTLRALRRHLTQALPLAHVRRLQRAGLVRVEEALSDPQVQPRQATHVRFAPAFRHDGAPAELKARLRGHKQRAVVEVLSGFVEEGLREPPQAEVQARAEASYGTIRSLLDKGILERVEREVRRSPFDDLPAPPADPPRHVLHPAQQSALDEIQAAVEEERYAAFLLHGVTGSGKTRVYVEALKAARARGKTALVLVPEIALTPQTVQRFRAHFPGEVAVLHSQMSLGERYDAWRGLREGRFSIAIGPRSAVLAPLENLGLVVVDEEHESSYKQFDPAPRYHARDVAVMRAHMAGAVCLLGSATPSLESLLNARRGKYELLEMPERVPVPGREAGRRAAAQLPHVRIVDLTKEHRKHRLDGALSVPLREAIAERLGREEQVILLQNRRGFAPVIECADCGHAPTCADCSVTLTYHKRGRRLRCHYCGRTRRLPRRCPECGAEALQQLGAGTQRVEDELAEVFPAARILRMGRDTTTRKGAHGRLLRQFGSGAADVLLGTQMIAKGLDFSRVTLVGVVSADVGLLMPDFRAEERTFQLLTQAAGRAGRGDRPGEVILQTRNPEAKALLHAARHDYAGFTEGALGERRELGYPPYGRLASIEFRGPKDARVRRLAEQWTRALTEHVRADGARAEGARAGNEGEGARAGAIEVLGPEPALIGRIKKQYRYRTLLRARRAAGDGLQALLRHGREHGGSPPQGYHVAIDVDAIGLT